MPARYLPSPKRYAQALLEVAQGESGRLQQWRQALERLATAVKDAALVSFLQSPGLTFREKRAVLDALLPNLPEPAYKLVLLLARRRALKVLPSVQEAFDAMADALLGVQRVEVRTALPLDEAQQRRIAEALRSSLSKEVHLAVRVDPQVLGGVVLRIGDRVIDGSARGRLLALRQALVEAR